ncbi:MAG: YjbH domain-containing protein [Acidaminococcales bacterium]|nr:YjbH domain-containing protein [Acidaminococcales bacterium]
MAWLLGRGCSLLGGFAAPDMVRPAAKNKALILLPLLLLGAFCRPAGAAVNCNGTDGLINIPSAYVRPAWKAGMGYFYADGGGVVAGNVNLPGDMELSCRYTLDGRGLSGGRYNLKIALLKEKILAPAIAAGAEDLAGENRRSYYLAVSKQGPWGLRLHLGAKSAAGLFGGLEKQFKLKGDLRKMLPFIPLFTLMLEYDGHNFNYGLYARNSRGMRIDVAWRGFDNKFIIGAQKEF